MRKLLLLLTVMCLLCVPVQAEEADLGGWVETEPLIEGLSGETAELLDGFDPEQGGEFSEGIVQIFSKSWEENKPTLVQAAGLAAVVICVVLLCATVGAMNDSCGLEPVSIAGALGITAACTFQFHAMIQLGAQTVQRLMEYATLLLPALASAVVATGAVGSAGAVYMGTVLFSDVLTVLISKLLIPMVYLYVGVATANCALGNHLLDSIRDLIAWLISGSLKAILYVYTGYITISGIISGATDAASVKATKLALSGMVPVVGGIISDASETLVASAAVLKNSIGVFGMLAVLAFCAAPFLRIAMHYLVLKLSKAVCGTVGRKNHVELVGNLSTAMGFLLGMTGTCALMLLLSIVCSLKAVAI